MIDDGNQSMMVQSRKHYPTVIEDLKLGMLARQQVILHAVEDRASHSLDCVNRPRKRFRLLWLLFGSRHFMKKGR